MPGLFSFGSNQSEQSASAQGSNFNINASTLFGPQSVAFSNLFNQATGVANNQAGNVGAAGQQLAGGLSGQGQDFLSQLLGGNNLSNFQPGQGGQLFNGLGGGSGFLESGFQQLQQLATGQTAAQGQLGQTQENPFLNQAIGNIGSDISQQLARQNVTIGQDATLAGTRGGSRQGVAQGIASGEALDAFAQQSGALRAADASQRQQLQQQGLIANLDSQLGAAQGLTGQALTGQLGEAQLGQGADQQLLSALQSSGALNNQAAGIGLGSLSDLFNLGLGGFGAEFSPLQALAGILGPGLFQDFGLGFGQSSSQSSGSGSGFNFGVGEL